MTGEREVRRILAVTGKTGGHVMPALAVADAFRARMPGVDVRFVAPERRLIVDLIERHGYRATSIRASRIVGGTVREKAEGMINLARGLADANRLLREYDPDVVIGFGSFLTPPVVMAARARGIFSAVQEQNSVPGWANRASAPFADLCFLSFEQSRAYFPKGRSLVVGNPVRASIASCAIEGEPEAPFTLLIVGGSQGARFLNTRLPKVVTRLLDAHDIRVVHQTGGPDHEMVVKLYTGFEDRVEVHDFIEDIGATYRRAHLAIARAGAGVVFELMSVGVPALFVPFPHAAGNHQLHNAMALANQGASLVVTEDEYDARRLQAIVEGLIEDPHELDTMRRKLRMLANPYAAEQIVDAIADGWAARSRRA